MKKLMFAAAVMAVGAAMAVESGVVGYTNKTIEQDKFRIVIPQFIGVADGSMLLKDLISTASITPFTIEWDEYGMPVTMNGATQIQVPSGNSYDTYYFCSNAYCEDEKYAATEYEVEGWADALGNLIEDAEFTQGVSVWFKDTEEESSFDVAGGVDAAPSVKVDCPVGFKLRGNPYPVATKLNDGDVTFVGVPFTIEWDDYGMPVTMEGASQIQVPSGNSYDTYYYCSNAYCEDEKYAASDYEVEGWCDALGNYIPDAEIPVSVGIWTKGGDNEFSLIFKNPVK